ncbi:NAD(P)H-dependent flavin oxidoreductase [Kitasatospora sp. NPDC048296]|uniref:NAD(P)H-dependent flavin oxidoreductase n=1 Tax=Kitasatospora sp. NPDC048296 TaxID=3364048 RepID=UPI0037177C47
MTRTFRTALGVDRPVVSAGMGGVAGPALAAAVARAGGLGLMGLYKATGQALDHMLTELVDMTDGQTGVSLVPEAVPPAVLAAQLDRILDGTPRRLAITALGTLPSTACTRIRAGGRRLLLQVGSAAQADAAIRLGADAVLVQGAHAGGRLLGSELTTDLVRAVRRRHPAAVIVAAGGIATGADAAEALAAGADAVCGGTAFIATHESDAHDLYKDRVTAATAEDTVVTDVFTPGRPRRPHRVLRNALTSAPHHYPKTFIGTTAVAGTRYPVYRFSAAAPTRNTTGRITEMAMYAGRCCSRVNARTRAADVVDRLAGPLECT